MLSTTALFGAIFAGVLVVVVVLSAALAFAASSSSSGGSGHGRHAKHWAAPRGPLTLWAWNQPCTTAGLARSTASLPSGVCFPYLWDSAGAAFTSASVTTGSSAATLKDFVLDNKQIGEVKLGYMGTSKKDGSVIRLSATEKAAVESSAKDLKSAGVLSSLLIGHKLVATGKGPADWAAAFALYDKMIQDAATFIVGNDLQTHVGISVDIEPSVADLNTGTDANPEAGTTAWYHAYLPLIAASLLNARKVNAGKSTPLRIGFAVNHNVQYMPSYAKDSGYSPSATPWQYMLSSGAVNVIEVMGWMTPYNGTQTAQQRVIDQSLAGNASATRNFFTDAALNKSKGGGFVQIGVETTGDPAGHVMASTGKEDVPTCVVNPESDAIYYNVTNSASEDLYMKCATSGDTTSMQLASVLPAVAAGSTSNVRCTEAGYKPPCSNSHDPDIAASVCTGDLYESGGASESACLYPTNRNSVGNIGAKLMGKLTLVQGPTLLDGGDVTKPAKSGGAAISELASAADVWTWLAETAPGLMPDISVGVAGKDQSKYLSPLSISVEDAGGFTGLIANYGASGAFPETAKKNTYTPNALNALYQGSSALCPAPSGYSACLTLSVGSSSALSGSRKRHTLTRSMPGLLAGLTNHARDSSS